jgi:hypothetical protein
VQPKYGYQLTVDDSPFTIKKRISHFDTLFSEGKIMKLVSVLSLLVLAIFSQNLSAGEDLIKTVSHGDRIELDKLLVPGKYTVVEFYADF